MAKFQGEQRNLAQCFGVGKYRVHTHQRNFMFKQSVFSSNFFGRVAPILSSLRIGIRVEIIDVITKSTQITPSHRASISAWGEPRQCYTHMYYYSNSVSTHIRECACIV